MIRTLICFTLLVVFTSLVACQIKVSQEIIIQNETRSNTYTHFINDPQSGKEKLIENDGQGIDKLLQDILLSHEKPSEATIKAFSQLFAEAYRNAINDKLSQSDNETYAQILGMIVGGLSGLREQVLAKRAARFLAGWYDYTELDKRWLALFTDIVSLDLFYELPEDMVEIARTGAVDEFAESLMQNDYVKRLQNDDLVDKMIYYILDVAIASFNGYKQETERSLRTMFSSTWVMARSNMKSLTY